MQQSHLAKVLPGDELTETTVSLNAWACLGFVFGPFFGLLASYIPPFKVQVPFLGPGSVLPFNEETSAGYFVLVSTVLIVFMVCFYFGDDTEHLGGDLGTTAGEREPLLPSGGPVVEGSPMTMRSSSLHPPGRSSKLMLALVMCNLAFFTHFYGFAIQETITT